MTRSRSVSPVGYGRFDNPYSPASHLATSSTAPTSPVNHVNKASYSSTTSSPTDNSTALTSATSAQASFSSEEAQQQEEWFGNFRDDLDIGDECPSAAALSAVSNIPIYDAEGNSRPFRSIFAFERAAAQRQLIIFIRHFYCGACQAFVKALVDGIPMDEYFAMPVPTSITIVGCGQPDLINHYKARTGCPFPVFADPTRAIFKGLGMSLTMKIGTRPEYMSQVSVPAVLAGFVKELKAMERRDRFRGGNMLQIGGEFLIEDGQVVWCHRMKNLRGHAEVPLLRRLLELDD